MTLGQVTHLALLGYLKICFIPKTWASLGKKNCSPETFISFKYLILMIHSLPASQNKFYIRVENVRLVKNIGKE